jgi:hypothetical protein
MHYGDKQQLKESLLEIVIYKHEVLGSTFKRNKDGVVSKRCVDYQITSIQKCEKFNPRVLNNLLSDPYKYLSKDLDNLPTEEWFLIKIVDSNGWKFEIKPMASVSEHPNEIYRLH